MADWVHCNLCFHQPGDSRKFSLTNCGHIYCELCILEGAGNKCKMCSSVCSSIALSSQMKPDVEIFFTDPVDLVQKQRKQLVQVMDFQKNHRRRLTAHIRDKLSKQGKLLEMSQKNVSQFNEIERQVRILREENLYLKKLINDKGIGGGSRPGTPGNRMSTSPGGYRASPGSTGHGQNSSPYRSSSTPGSHRVYSVEMQLSNAKGTSSQAMQSAYSTPPSAVSRVSVRTPPSHGRIGVIPSTPSPCHTPQGRTLNIRPSTPGAGDALRKSPGIYLHSPAPMNTGTPRTPHTTPHAMQLRSTPGAGDALRKSPGIYLHSPAPMNTGTPRTPHTTPHAIQLPASMGQYCPTVNGSSPTFAIHTPRGADR